MAHLEVSGVFVAVAAVGDPLLFARLSPDPYVRGTFVAAMPGE